MSEQADNLQLHQWPTGFFEILVERGIKTADELRDIHGQFIGGLPSPDVAISVNKLEEKKAVIKFGALRGLGFFGRHIASILILKIQYLRYGYAKPVLFSKRISSPSIDSDSV